MLEGENLQSGTKHCHRYLHLTFYFPTSKQQGVPTAGALKIVDPLGHFIET